MKKYLAVFMTIALILSLSVPAFADDNADENVIISETEGEDSDRAVTIKDSDDQDKPILNTDVASSDYEMTHFDDRAELEEETRITETEDAYADLYKYIGRDATFSVYWFESEVLPIDVTITVENLEEYKSYGYLYWKDDVLDSDWDSELTEEDKNQHLRDNWYEIKHEFDKVEVADEDLAFDLSKESIKESSDKKTHTVTLTLESNQPIAIVSPYGLYLAGLDVYLTEKPYQPYAPSVVLPPVIERGNQTAEKPTVIASDEDVNIVPYKDIHPDLELITEEQWEQFKQGCKELKDQVPEKMTTRYLFYLIEDRSSDIVIRMEDIVSADKVKCKLYDGSWHDQFCKVTEPGRITIHADNTGLFAVFTEIATDIFDD